MAEFLVIVGAVVAGTALAFGGSPRVVPWLAVLVAVTILIFVALVVAGIQERDYYATGVFAGLLVAGIARLAERQRARVRGSFSARGTRA